MALRALGHRIQPLDMSRAKASRDLQHKAGRSVYATQAWRLFRAAIIKERGSICQQCGAKGPVHADHTTSIQDGGRIWDRANIKLLCSACHAIKTRDEEKTRLAWRPPL